MKFKEINIFEYKDYRKLLADIFNIEKSRNKNHTYGKWAKAIGLSSVSGLTMILKGQRHAGKGIQEKLILNLELDEKEQQYFQQLVKIQKQAKDDESLVVFLMDNGETNKDNTLKDDNRPIQFRWEMGLLREATKWSNLKEDLSWLNDQSRFIPKTKSFMEVLNEMKKEEILKYHDGALKINGNYQSKDIDTRYFKHLHNDFIEFSKKSYEIDFNKRSLEYRMIMIKKEDIPKAKDRLIQLLDKFADEFDTKEATREESEIYLTALQFFPFTK